MRSLPRPARLVTASLALATLLPAALATPAMAALSVHLDATIGSCAISGGSKDPEPFTIRVKARDGHLKGSFLATPDAHGHFEGCITGERVQTGDRITAVRGGITLKAVNVPLVTVAGDRVTDTISGRAPGNTSIDVSALQCDFHTGGGCLIGYATSFTVPANGTWSKSIGADWDLRGGEHVRAVWMDGKDDTVARELLVPYVEVRIGSPKVRGAGRPGIAAHLRLKTSSDAPKAALARVPRQNGAFTGRLRRGTSFIPVASGDHVRSDVASDAAFTAKLPVVFIGGLPDAVGATCQGGAAWTLSLREIGGSGTFFTAGHADGGGTVTVPGIVSAHSGWRMLLRCQTHQGDVVGRSMTLP